MEDFRRNRLWEKLSSQVRNLEDRVTEMQQTPPSESQMKRVEMEISVAETRLEEYMQSIEDQFDSLAGQSRDDYMETCSVNYRAVDERIKAVKDQLWQIKPQSTGSMRAVGARPERKGNLNRLSLPTFTGNEQDYGEFKRTFMELVQAEVMEDSIFLAHLRMNLPIEAKDLIAGITSREDAITKLDKIWIWRYENDNIIDQTGAKGACLEEEASP